MHADRHGPGSRMSSPAVENSEVQSIPSAESMRADIAGASVEAMDFKRTHNVQEPIGSLLRDKQEYPRAEPILQGAP